MKTFFETKVRDTNWFFFYNQNNAEDMNTEFCKLLINQTVACAPKKWLSFDSYIYELFNSKTTDRENGKTSMILETRTNQLGELVV